MNSLNRRQMLASCATGLGSFLVAGCVTDGRDTQQANKREPRRANASAKSPAEPSDRFDQAIGTVQGVQCDKSNIDEESEERRDSLSYVENSQHADDYCASCVHYERPASGKICGGCKLIKGPVNPHGYCNGFAAKKS